MLKVLPESQDLPDAGRSPGKGYYHGRVDARWLTCDKTVLAARGVGSTRWPRRFHHQSSVRAVRRASTPRGDVRPARGITHTTPVGVFPSGYRGARGPSRQRRPPRPRGGREIKRIDATVEGDLAVRWFRGQTDEERAGFRSVRAIVTVGTGTSDEDVAAWLEDLRERDPVINNLVAPTPVELAITANGSDGTVAQPAEKGIERVSAYPPGGRGDPPVTVRLPLGNGPNVHVVRYVNDDHRR